MEDDPVRVVESAEDPEATQGAVDTAGRRLFKPISFPWTVSLTDPLILRVIARTKRCPTTWRARITWRSGEKSGVIPIDNGGQATQWSESKGFRNLVRSGTASSGWARFR